MRGLIARILAGQAAAAAARPLTAGQMLDASIAERRERRLALPPRTEAKRFAAARPKVQQLREEIARQMVDF